MNTIWTGTSAYGLQLTYIDNRNYPGGPLGFLAVEFSLTPNVLSLASYIIGNVLADAFLVSHCSDRIYGILMYTCSFSSGVAM